jgi:hypothetical protein
MAMLRLPVLAGATVAAGLVLAGCATIPVHDQTVDEAAAVMEHKRCSPDVDEKSIAPVLSGVAVERWEPAYNFEASTGSDSKRLAGAVFTVRAIKGYTSEWLDRALECHSARRVLGRIPTADEAKDPFWLPGSAVDIDVQSTGKDFQVSVRSTDVADANKIVARAKAFTERPGPR